MHKRYDLGLVKLRTVDTAEAMRRQQLVSDYNRDREDDERINNPYSQYLRLPFEIMFSSDGGETWKHLLTREGMKVEQHSNSMDADATVKIPIMPGLYGGTIEPVPLPDLPSEVVDA